MNNNNLFVQSWTKASKAMNPAKWVFIVAWNATDFVLTAIAFPFFIIFMSGVAAGCAIWKGTCSLLRFITSNYELVIAAPLVILLGLPFAMILMIWQGDFGQSFETAMWLLAAVAGCVASVVIAFCSLVKRLYPGSEESLPIA